MFTLNRITIAGAALLLAALGCASGGAAENPGGSTKSTTTTISLDALPAGDPSAGEALFSGAKPVKDGDDLSCHACHSLDGSSGVGPSLQGISTRVPQGYASAKAYLYESIVQPGAYVRGGFMADVMPGNFDKKLDGQALADLIAFLAEQ